MNEFSLFVKKRGITRLCHFTRINNLPFIFGTDNAGSIPNGIVSRRIVKGSDLFTSLPRGMEYTDAKRLDCREDLISTSIQVPNSKYFSRVINKEKIKGAFNEFCIVLINPNIIDDETIFCPGNAATKGYRDILKDDDDKFKGLEAFKCLFRDVNNPKHGLIKRGIYLPNNYTTDEQAEVMIPNHIPVNYIDGIVFKDKETAIMESDKLQLCNVVDISHKKFYYCQNMFAKSRQFNVNLETV